MEIAKSYGISYFGGEDLIREVSGTARIGSWIIMLEEGIQGSHRLEKYLNLEGFLEKSFKIESALKSTRKSLKSLEKSLNASIFCRT